MDMDPPFYNWLLMCAAYNARDGHIPDRGTPSQAGISTAIARQHSRPKLLAYVSTPMHPEMFSVTGRRSHPCTRPILTPYP